MSNATLDVQALPEPSRGSSAGRPANIARSAFHVACGVVALTMLAVLPSRAWVVGVSATAALAGWTMELSRKRSASVNQALMKLFAPVAHPHERHGVNSATWYTSALAILAFAPVRAAALGIIVLAVGDPLAGFVGRRFGRTRIRASRSLEGTATFIVTAALAAAAFLAITTSLGLPQIALLALAAGVAGALAELYSFFLDDNFTIPVVTTLVAALTSFALHLG